MRLFDVQGFHIPRLIHSLSKIVFNKFWVWKQKTVLLAMEIYFPLPFAILGIAFITENETKVYRFHLVSLHISIVHYVVILGTKIKYCQRTIMTTVSSLGVYI